MWSSFISKITIFASNLLFPQTCLFCNTGDNICCGQCFSEIPQNTRLQNNILSIYHFSEPKINKLIWQLKYHHGGDIAKLFGAVLAEKLEKILFPIFPPTTQNIFLVPIPLNQSDKRLHNHAELLAKEILASLQYKIPQKIFILNNLLIKNSKQKQSHTKGRAERFENIKGAFSLNHNFKLPRQNSRNFATPSTEGESLPTNNNLYIIVDDVTTSGATITEARKTLAPFLNLTESEIYTLTAAY